MVDQLEQLRKMTTVVADTGDFEMMKQYAPLEATTNPSLIYQASKDPKYAYLIDEAIQEAMNVSNDVDTALTLATEKVFVKFAQKILEVVPGRVSVEVDASLSFDTQRTIEKARSLIKSLEEEQIDRKRILIKIATTWEGIQAAKVLEAEGIHCNMTLIFSLYQAIACGAINATLISPFVGRIVDWYSKANNISSYMPDEDPGVICTKEMYNYYKKFDIPTVVMAASLRSKEQVAELAGCDLMTIPLKVLDALANSQETINQKLSPIEAKEQNIDKLVLSESGFRFMMNKDAMATEKLADGIRRFDADMEKLKGLLLEKIQEKA